MMLLVELEAWKRLLSEEEVEEPGPVAVRSFSSA